MKALSGRELCTPVERQGGTLLRVRGSHHVYGKAGVSVRLIIPVHGGRSLPQGLLAISSTKRAWASRTCSDWTEAVATDRQERVVRYRTSRGHEAESGWHTGWDEALERAFMKDQNHAVDLSKLTE